MQPSEVGLVCDWWVLELDTESSNRCTIRITHQVVNELNTLLHLCYLIASTGHGHELVAQQKALLTRDDQQFLKKRQIIIPTDEIQIPWRLHVEQPQHPARTHHRQSVADGVELVLLPSGHLKNT